MAGTKEDIIKQEEEEILNCNHDFYGENPPRKKDRPDVAQEDVFCKKCGQHFIRIIAVYRENLFNPDKTYLGPKCEVCGKQDKVDEFVPECWLQIPYSMDNKEHGIIIWVCPDCIAKKANIN